jgi:hypothetical protein
MPGKVIGTPHEYLMRMPVPSLKEELPSVLGEIREYGIEKLLGECPDFMERLFEKLRQAEAAKFFSEAPALTDQVTSLLWDGVAYRAVHSKEMKSVLEKVDRDFGCNIEASDSPFRSHFSLEKGEIHGAPGLLHFNDEDFRFMGPTEVLIELLTGDLLLGFSNLRLQTAGHPGWIRRIAPVMREIGRIIKGLDIPV